jgi:hypothetical protein
MGDATGTGDGNTESLSKSTNTANFNNFNKKIEDERMKGDKPGHAESSHFQGQFIPTCISPYRPNASAFTL